MHSLYYLKNHAIAFIELALAAGVVYLIACTESSAHGPRALPPFY